MPVIYSDLASEVIPKLRQRLSGRPEPYAGGVTITNRRLRGTGRQVVIQEAPGGGETNTLDDTSLRVNIFAPDEGDCADLASLVRAILTSPAPLGIVDGSPIVRAVTNAGPNQVEDDTEVFRRYLVVNVRRRGIPFTA